MNEEALIRKLVADGDGTNDDKRLVSLFGFIDAMKRDVDNTALILKIEQVLMPAENSFMKQLAVADMCQETAKHVINFGKAKEVDILKLREQIEAIKVELAEAKLIRRNKQEYDAMAKLILDKPSRAETMVSLEKLEIELQELLEQQKELEGKLGDKRKNMYALAMLLDDLEAAMDADPVTTAADDDEDLEMDSISQK